MNLKPKRILFAVAALVLMMSGTATVFFISRAEQASGATSGETLYTCGMHPQVIEPKPGLCPICGMKLTPIRKQSTSVASSPGELKDKYYKSTMMPGEVSPAPKQDSMGMDMVPAYEDEWLVT